MLRIDEVLKHAEHIEVFATLGLCELELNIDKQHFYDWLVDNDRINWEMDYAGDGGEHKQICGTYSAEEYFDLATKHITDDIAEYIKANGIALPHSLN